MKVLKFGGTSLADAAQIKKVCDIILSDPERRIVVVSAPGKRSDNDVKVTDLLIAAAQACLSGQSGKEEMEAVIERFADIVNGRGDGLAADVNDGLAVQRVLDGAVLAAEQGIRVVI